MRIDRRRFVAKKNHGKFFPSHKAVRFDKKTVFEVEVRPRSPYSSTLMRISVSGLSDEEVKFNAIIRCCADFQGQMLDNPDEWVVTSMTEIDPATLSGPKVEKPFTKAHAKKLFGESFWDRTNSVKCKTCGKSNFFRGNDTPKEFKCVHCQ